MTNLQFLLAVSLISFPLGIVAAGIAGIKLIDKNEYPGDGAIFIAAFIFGLMGVSIAFGLRILL